jgi:hypothetical protein
MTGRSEFARKLAEHVLTHEQRAIALLWYYRQSQEFDERSASELANDLYDEGFPKPNTTRLKNDLTRSPFTIRGRRLNAFQIDVRRLAELDKDYGPMIHLKQVQASDAVIPTDWVAGTRPYLEKLVYQINASYDIGLYDGCAVLCRRLMESLIIEVYISHKRHQEIQQNGIFLPLSQLVVHLKNDASMPLGRNSRDTFDDIKDIGDTAAHDRTYITRQTDIDAIKVHFGQMISDLLHLCGIHP